MKTSLSSHPGLVCRMVRRWSSSGSAHAARCADCQTFFAAARELESGLRRDAARLLPDDAALEHGILQAVRRSAENAGTARAQSRAPSRNQGGFWIAGAALAALAFAVVIFQRGPGEGVRAREAASVVVTRADAAAIVDTVNSLSDRLTDSVIPSAAAIVADNPLQREMDSIYEDARSALGFLAMNFLPSAEKQEVRPRSG